MLRILVVDDDRNCLESVESVLQKDGHQIVTAAGGEEAIGVMRRLRLENQRLDLSILDFDMPGLTGIEIFSRLLFEFPGIEAVFISGDASEARVERVRRAGARGFLRKPLDVERVRGAVRAFRRGGFLVA